MATSNALSVWINIAWVLQRLFGGQPVRNTGHRSSARGKLIIGGRFARRVCRNRLIPAIFQTTARSCFKTSGVYVRQHYSTITDILCLAELKPGFANP